MPGADRRSDKITASTRSRRAILAWTLYDWANSPFTTLIITFLFPAYFAQAVIGSEVRGQSLWGYAIGSSGLIVAVFSPILGAIADAGGRRKPWLLVFSGICILASASFWFVEPGNSFSGLAILLAVVSNVGFEFGVIFNNAMLPDLVPEEMMGRWSGWAWGLGYAGGLLALVLVLLGLVQHSISWLPLDRAHAEHIRIVGPLVALWFAVFAWPLFIWTPDRPRSGLPPSAAIRKGLRTLNQTMRGLGAKRNIALFLIAHMLYADALVAIFAFGGIYASGTFGMSLAEITSFGIVLNVTAGIGAFAFAWLDDWIGSRKTILLSLAGLIATSLVTVTVHERFWFWIAGSALGAFVGPAQAASRSLMARLAPKGQESEFFGLFAFSGKATAFLGPTLVALVTDVSGSQRVGLASLLILLGSGALLLLPVSEVGIARPKRTQS